MDRSFEMIISIPDQLTIAIAILITLAILVSCGLSRMYVHKGRNHDPGHTLVVCTKYAAARPAGAGPPPPPPPYPVVVETPV